MLPSIDLLEYPSLPKIYHLGPALTKGALPSIFYFSLSGEESLGLDPYNQPAICLAEQGIRVFSITLPAHEGEFPHPNAIKEWVESYSTGKNTMEKFAEICLKSLDFLIKSDYIDPLHIGISGLSRGAFIATQVAALDERIKIILGFAPLTSLTTMKDFKDILGKDLLYQSPILSLNNLIPKLINKTVRFYIGNCDTLVKTSSCFSFIHTLSETAYQNKHRFAPIELIVYPSIGHKGHGTPPEIFGAGALWIAKELGVIKNG